MSESLSGLIAAPFTPMGADGSVNLDAIEPYARMLAASGVAGGFVCGTTGESMSLTIEERMGVAERWCEAAPDGFAVIVHVGHTTLAYCQALAEHAQRIGAGAIGTMAPCFHVPSGVDDLVAFCAETAAAAPELPFYFYHIPSMTHVEVPMVEFLECAGQRIPTLAGVKYTHWDLMEFGRCLDLDGGRYTMLFGRDEYLLAGLSLGAPGAVGSTYNFAAPLYRRLIDAFEAGDLAAAQAAQARARELIAALFARGGMPAFKAVMKLVGIDCGPVRPPLRPMADDQQAALRPALDELGFFDFCAKASA